MEAEPGAVNSMDRISFRLAVEADLPFLLDLRRRTMTEHQLASGVHLSDREQRERVLERFECARLVLLAGEPVGLFKVARDGNEWTLLQIQIVPEQQGAGLGRSLVQGLVDEAKASGASLRLRVLRANPARRLYERLGFRIETEEAHAYRMKLGAVPMKVDIVSFPETKVAAIEHRGPPELEHDTVRKLVAWKLEQRLLDPLRHRSYGVHYTDPRTTPPLQHRVDFCLSVEEEVGPNPYGIVNKVIPASRCARARDVGSRSNNQAVVYLFEQWLPASAEAIGDFPVFFHYVNVGPNVREEDMITDVYLPLE